MFEIDYVDSDIQKGRHLHDNIHRITHVKAAQPHINIIRPSRSINDVPIVSIIVFHAVVAAKSCQAVTRTRAGGDTEHDSVTSNVLFDMLEEEMENYQVRGTNTIVNLDPEAPRGPDGNNVPKIPSDIINR